MRQHLLHPLLPAIIFLLLTAATAFCRANPDIVTLTLPEAMIRQSVQSVLPLPIVPEGDHLQGKLVLDSISKLEMRDNGALVQGTVLGSGLTLKTKVGNQSLNMKIGLMETTSQPLFVAMDFLLVIVVIYHAMNGLRVVLFDLGVGIRRQKLVFWVTMAIAAVLIVGGLLAIWHLIFPAGGA